MDWSAIGIFRTPTEAAVTAGARMAASWKFGERRLNRRRFVLSSWEIIEQN